MADLISQAAEDVANGEFDDQFPIDIFQTGSGTSTNMNANEVISSARRKSAGCREYPPERSCQYGPSSNDVIPTSISVAATSRLPRS